MYSAAAIRVFLEAVKDPEVPVLSIIDLGVLRDVQIENEKVKVRITPTYSGCPAMQSFSQAIKIELMSRGIREVEVEEVLQPAWTTDWMTESGKQKLKAYGIAPPRHLAKDNEWNDKPVECPHCQSENTRCISQFGSTACKALYQCNDCLEPFDFFKCH